RVRQQQAEERTRNQVDADQRFTGAGRLDMGNVQLEKDLYTATRERQQAERQSEGVEKATAGARRAHNDLLTQAVRRTERAIQLQNELADDEQKLRLGLGDKARNAQDYERLQESQKVNAAALADLEQRRAASGQAVAQAQALQLDLQQKQIAAVQAQYAA